MIPSRNNRKVLVTGGATFLGDHIAAALLAEGAEVTLLVRPEVEDRTHPLRDRVRWVVADVWDTASLRGRARGHFCVVNTIGSMTADPAQGLTHHRLNFVSARNIINMVISDGVSHAILMSSPRAPWISRQYISAKRDAEEYVDRVGVSTTIIRAPLAYMRGSDRPLFYAMISALGTTPPLSWTAFGRIAPIPVDVLARGVARIALNGSPAKHIVYGQDLRRLNTRDELKNGGLRLATPRATQDNAEGDTKPRPRFTDLIDDETQFGWMPPRDKS